MRVYSFLRTIVIELVTKDTWKRLSKAIKAAELRVCAALSREPLLIPHCSGLGMGSPPRIHVLVFRVAVLREDRQGAGLGMWFSGRAPGGM